MPIPKDLSRRFASQALVATILIAAIGSAPTRLVAQDSPAFGEPQSQRDANNKNENTTEWSVSFFEDTAEIHASSRVSVGLIQRTIRALQNDGIKKFSLRSYDVNAPVTNAPTVKVQIHDGEAEISASYDVSYKHIVSVISVLSENGVRKMKFAPARGDEQKR